MGGWWGVSALRRSRRGRGGEGEPVEDGALDADLVAGPLRLDPLVDHDRLALSEETPPEFLEGQRRGWGWFGYGRPIMAALVPVLKFGDGGRKECVIFVGELEYLSSLGSDPQLGRISQGGDLLLRFNLIAGLVQQHENGASPRALP